MLTPVQPQLADDRVRMRPMLAGDFDALFAVAADPEIWVIHPMHDRWQEPVFRAVFADCLASNGSLVVHDAATGAVIGHSRYDTRYCEPGELEIGWTFLARSHWGGTYNWSAKRLMLAHAFASGWDRVIFRIGETNLRSRRAIEKIGAMLTDRRQVAELTLGSAVHVVYRIDREDFTRGPLA